MSIWFILMLTKNLPDKQYQKAKGNNMCLFFIKFRPLMLVINMNMFCLKKAFFPFFSPP